MTFKIQIDFNVLFPGGGVEIINTLANLLTLGNKIMTAISESVAAQKAAFDRLEAALGGIGEDITALAAKIAELQASGSAITPADQALLDQATSLADGLATRFEALDALNTVVSPPPVTPSA